MQESIKSKTIKGVAWSSVEKIFSNIISFILGILIARILSPEDYGIIGILMVFVTFSNIFIDGGMSVALIQKTECTDEDYNTAFLYNFCVSVLIYIGLFFSAPFISSFFDNDIFTPLLRVISLSIIISSISAIQSTKLQRDLDFKSLSISSIFSCVIAGVAGLFAAIIGLSVWALVIQQLVMCIVKTIILVWITSWKPQKRISKKSFNELFSFGSRLIVTNLLAKIYDNLFPLIIGKIFPMSILGNYTRGQHFAQMPVSILQEVFQRVSFPIMSSIKSDKERLSKLYRLYIEMTSAIVFPLMFILVLIAKPLILLVLTDKWVDAYPFMQILCVGFMFNHISAINLNLLFVEGRSDLALKLEIVKKTVAISILFISLIWGIWGICIGQAIYAFIATILNSKYTKRIIGLSYWSQLKDYVFYWVYSFLSLIISYELLSMFDGLLMKIILGILFYCIVYAIINWFFKTNLLCNFINIKKYAQNKN